MLSRLIALKDAAAMRTTEYPWTFKPGINIYSILDGPVYTICLLPQARIGVSHAQGGYQGGYQRLTGLEKMSNDCQSNEPKPGGITRYVPIQTRSLKNARFAQLAPNYTWPLKSNVLRIQKFRFRSNDFFIKSLTRSDQKEFFFKSPINAWEVTWIPFPSHRYLW